MDKLYTNPSICVDDNGYASLNYMHTCFKRLLIFTAAQEID